MSIFLWLEPGTISPTTSIDKGDLIRPTFTPDYTVRAVTDLHYLMINYSAFKAAILATIIERNNTDPSNTSYQDEIDEVDLHMQNCRYI
jgi:hypothetical protein